MDTEQSTPDLVTMSRAAVAVIDPFRDDPTCLDTVVDDDMVAEDDISDDGEKSSHNSITDLSSRYYCGCSLHL